MVEILLKKLIATLTAIIALQTPHFGGAEVGPTYFAQVDANGIVQRVIVISQENIDTGNWGDPATFIQTSMDGSIGKNYAGKGYKYESGITAFVAPKPTADATLDSLTGQWTVPKAIVPDSPTSTPK